MPPKCTPTLLCLPNDKLEELVELYKKEECLWNKSSPSYRSKKTRQLAFEKIARILNVPKLEAKHVMLKMNSLKSFYCNQLKRISNLSPDGEMAIDIKKEWPKCLTLMDSFLRPHVQIQNAYSGPTLVINGGVIKREPEPELVEDPDDLWDSSCCEDLTTDDPEPTAEVCGESNQAGAITSENNKRPASSIGSNSPKRANKNHNEDLLAESLKDVSTQLAVLKEDLANTKAGSSKAAKDEGFHDNFGKYVASMLRMLPMRKSVQLQSRIVNMIAAEMLQDQDEIFYS